MKKGKRNVTLAQRKVDEAKLADAKRRLDKTRVILPFDAKLAEINVEQDQVVAMGSVMLIAHQLGQIEVKTEISLRDIRTLAASIDSTQSQSQMPNIEAFNLEANITLHAGSLAYTWPARVTRIADTVNPDQATIGVYLEVDQDYRKLNPTKKPPLTNGMFVTATIIGQPKHHKVIPEKALHGDQIYLMSENNRLKIQQVKVLFRQDNQVAISAEIPSDARLVLNDLIPAVKGMSLKTQVSDSASEGDTE